MNIAEEWIKKPEERFGEINSIHKIGCEDKTKPEIVFFFFENLHEKLLTAEGCKKLWCVFRNIM